MDRWHAMKVFVKVADSGGFAEAARQLDMSPAAVTRAVASLEQTIGARLFVRSTRAVKLTDTGMRYLQDCRRILAEIEEAEALAAGSHIRPSGTLTVTASVLFGQTVVLPILTEYLSEHPAVVGRVLLVDRLTNLIDEGIDVAVRIGHLPDSGLRAIPVGFVHRVVCGAPSYFQQHGVPLQPADLAAHRIIATTSAWNSLEWHFGSGDSASSVTVCPRLFCNTIEAARSAAKSGWGLARLLSYQVETDIRERHLQAVLDNEVEPPLPVHIVHSEGPHAAAKVRSFIDFAVERLRANPLINPPARVAA